MASEADVTWLTVPTRGRDTLSALIRDCGLPSERIVIVRTEPVTLEKNVEECVVLDDFDGRNIQRWWRRGIQYALNHGGRYVAVANDDIVIDQHTIPRLVAALADTGATISSPSPTGLSELWTASTHVTRQRYIVGSLWVLDLKFHIFPDEEYRWWYGDDDLDHRARDHGGGVAWAPVTFSHLYPDAYTGDPEIQRLIAADRARYHAVWGPR